MISPVTLPEIVLLNTLNSALNFVRTDYAAASDKTKSWLYYALNGATLDKYGLYKQAVAVIIGSTDSPRALSIDLMFNMKHDKVPAIHITLPYETTGQGNGMGTDEGYAEIEYEDQDINPIGQDSDLNEDHRRAIYSRRLMATYDLVIISDNSNEVVLLFHFIRALLIATIPHLHLNRLQNISFGGRDIQPYAELASHLHMRTVTVSLQYDTFVPAIHSDKLITDVIVDGTPMEG